MFNRTASSTIIIFVTSEGLTDPRVSRSIQTAMKMGFDIRLVCRSSNAAIQAEPGIVVHRIKGLVVTAHMKQWLRARHRHARTRPVTQERAASPLPSLWLKPKEIWMLCNILWFNLRAFITVRRYPAALYHANDLDTLPAAVFLARLKGIPLLYDAHELFSSQFTGCSRQLRTILFALEHWLIRSAQGVVTVNQSLAKTLAEWHGIPLPTVIMNCPFGTVPSHRPETEHVVRVIYQGLLLPDRGLEELILSAAWYEQAELYLRGYGSLEPELRELVRREKLEERVHFLTPATPSQLVQGLTAFDVGVLAYKPVTLDHYFCLPNKIFEYMQAGLALAVSRLPELERVVKDCDGGELFDPYQPKDIARTINLFVCNKPYMHACQTRSRYAGAERYTWEIQGEPRLRDCYQRLTMASASPMESLSCAR